MADVSLQPLVLMKPELVFSTELETIKVADEAFFLDGFAHQTGPSEANQANPAPSDATNQFSVVNA